MSHPQAATAWPEPTSRFVEVDGVKLHYLDWGGRPGKHTFLLLHGGAAHVHWWDAVAPLLVPHGRVIALDFRGHGRSAWANPPHYGPQWYLHDVRGVIEYLGTRVILVGHSMGGAVAQWFATTYPDQLEALIVVDAPHGPPPLLRRLMWRWRRKARGGARPQLDSAEAIKRKFRLHRRDPISPNQISRGSRCWAPSNCRMADGRFGSTRIPAPGASSKAERASRRSRN